MVFLRYFVWICLFSRLFAHEYSLSVIAKFRNEGDYLHEWIEYHRLVGVEHFWLYNDGSTDDYARVLAPYIASGEVELFQIERQEGYGQHIATQIHSYKQGLKRAMGRSKWVAMIDIDEFLLPRQHLRVTECLDAHFSHADSVFINWKSFGTSKKTLAKGAPILTQLTSCAPKNHGDCVQGKTILRPESCLIDKIFYVHHMPMKPGTNPVDGRGVTIRFKNHDFVPLVHYDSFLRINHYQHRDETFFRTRRLKENRYKNTKRLLEKYQSFNQKRDTFMVEFLQKHPRDNTRLWFGSFDQRV